MDAHAAGGARCPGSLTEGPPLIWRCVGLKHGGNVKLVAQNNGKGGSEVGSGLL